MSDSPVRVLVTLSAFASVAGLAAWREHHWRLLLPVESAASTASATPAAPAPPAPGGKGTPAPSSAFGAADATEDQLRVQIIDLKARADQALNENTKLRAQNAALLEAAEPPPIPENLAADLAKQRGLTFPQPPVWTPVPMEDILKRLQAEVDEALPADAGQARARAARAMGFAAETFDYRAAKLSLAQMTAGGAYDPGPNRFLYQADADLKRADAREAFVGALAPVLLRQNFPLAAQNHADTANDDAACAALALVYGDANQMRVRYSIADQLNLNFAQPGAPGQPPPVYNAPVYLAETWKFTHDKGSLFAEAVQAKGGPTALNQAYTRPPRSSAEIMHPEKLYLAEPPFVPQDITFPDTIVNGTAAYHTNVAGEFGTYILLRSQLDVDQCADAAEGWLGDRYACWAGDETHGDHTFWKTVWTTPEDAKAFFDAERRALMQRFSIPWKKEYDTAEGRFSVSDPRRILRLALGADGKTVTLLNATDPAFAAALESATATW